MLVANIPIAIVSARILILDIVLLGVAPGLQFTHFARATMDRALATAASCLFAFSASSWIKLFVGARAIKSDANSKVPSAKELSFLLHRRKRSPPWVPHRNGADSAPRVALCSRRDDGGEASNDEIKNGDWLAQKRWSGARWHHRQNN